jgi:hypothetical protein
MPETRVKALIAVCAGKDEKEVDGDCRKIDEHKKNKAKRFLVTV